MSLGDFLDKRATALSVSEVAEVLNISERQVYKLAADSVIPWFRPRLINPVNPPPFCGLAHGKRRDLMGRQARKKKGHDLAMSASSAGIPGQ